MQGRIKRSSMRLVCAGVVAVGTIGLARSPAGGAGKLNDLEWFRQTQKSPAYAGYAGSYADGYPAPEVQAVPAARANAAMARAEYRRAYNHLNQVIRETRRSFEKSEEMQEAQAAERAAWQALQNARMEVLAELAKDPEYRAALQLREDLHAQIADRRLNSPTNKPPSREVIALATMKMSYATEARIREQALLRNDPELEDLKFEYQDAASRVIELRNQFEDELRASPELASGREALVQARSANLVAAEHLDSVLKARRLSLHYASNFYDIQPRYFRTGHLGYPYFSD